MIILALKVLLFALFVACAGALFHGNPDARMRRRQRKYIKGLK